MRPFALFRCRGYVRGTAQARKMVSSTSEFSSSARVETLLLASPKLEFALENSFRLEKAPAWRHPRVLSVEGPALCSAQGRPVAWGGASARGGTVDRLQESAYAYRVTHPLHIGSLLRAAVRARYCPPCRILVVQPQRTSSSRQPNAIPFISRLLSDRLLTIFSLPIGPGHGMFRCLEGLLKSCL